MADAKGEEPYNNRDNVAHFDSRFDGVADEDYVEDGVAAGDFSVPSAAPEPFAEPSAQPSAEPSAESSAGLVTVPSAALQTSVGGMHSSWFALDPPVRPSHLAMVGADGPCWFPPVGYVGGPEWVPVLAIVIEDVRYDECGGEGSCLALLGVDMAGFSTGRAPELSAEPYGELALEPSAELPAAGSVSFLAHACARVEGYVAGAGFHQVMADASDGVC